MEMIKLTLRFFKKSFFIWVFLFVMYFLSATSAHMSFEKTIKWVLLMLGAHLGGVTLAYSFLPYVVDEIKVEVVDDA